MSADNPLISGIDFMAQQPPPNAKRCFSCGDRPKWNAGTAGDKSMFSLYCGCRSVAAGSVEQVLSLWDSANQPTAQPSALVEQVLECRLDELADWEDIFRQCGTVTRGEAEDREFFLKFKYACGRNWERVSAEVKRQQGIINDMLSVDVNGWSEYLREVEAANQEHCTKDEHGAPVLKPGKDGNQNYTFTAEARKVRDGIVEFLKGKYADAIKAKTEQEQAVQRYMESTVAIPLFCVPWAWIPERLNASYLAKVAVMCTGAPEGIANEPPAAPAEGDHHADP